MIIGGYGSAAFAGTTLWYASPPRRRFSGCTFAAAGAASAPRPPPRAPRATGCTTLSQSSRVPKMGDREHERDHEIQHAIQQERRDQVLAAELRQCHSIAASNTPRLPGAWLAKPSSVAG